MALTVAKSLNRSMLACIKHAVADGKVVHGVVLGNDLADGGVAGAQRKLCVVFGASQACEFGACTDQGNEVPNNDLIFDQRLSVDFFFANDHLTGRWKFNKA